MATENSFLNNHLRGQGSLMKSIQVIPLVVNGNTTVINSAAVPAGSVVTNAYIETPVAITGTPTTCNVTIGTTSGGADVVATVDAHTQGHISATILATFNKIAGASTGNIFAQVITSGGTSSAGTIYAVVEFAAPVGG